jgi:hypothetical protein
MFLQNVGMDLQGVTAQKINIGIFFTFRERTFNAVQTQVGRRGASTPFREISKRGRISRNFKSRFITHVTIQIFRIFIKFFKVCLNLQERRDDLRSSVVLTSL